MTMTSAPALAQVRSQTLDQDTFTVALDAGPASGESGLKPSLWQGLDDAEVLMVLDAAGYGMTSPAAAKIQRAVLFTGATAPNGAATAPQVQIGRIQALYEAGHVNAATELLALGSGLSGHEQAVQFDVLTRFLRDDANGACRAANAVDAGAVDAFWARTRAACFALAGEGAAAELTLDIARRQGGEGLDSAFSYWIADAAGAPTFADPQPPRDAVEFALWRTTGEVFSAEDVRAFGAPLQFVLASDADAPADVRQIAAEVSAVRGAVDLRALGEVYADQVGDQDPRAMLAAGFETDAAANSAVFIQAAIAGNNPDLTIDALSAALQSTDGLPEFVVTARYLRPALADAPATFLSGGFAPLFAQASLAAGDVDTARNWVNAAFGADDANRFEYALLAAMLTAIDPAADGAKKADAVRGLVAEARDDNARMTAERAGLLLLAIGADPADDIRAIAAAGAGAAPDLTAEGEAVRDLMRAAADNAAPAPSALYAAVLVDTEGAQSTLAVAQAAQTLWWFGLDDHARAVALEGLLALTPRFALPPANGVEDE